MMRRPVSRRVLKWTATIGCIVLATVITASPWYHVLLGFTIGAHGIAVGISRGYVWWREFDLQTMPEFSTRFNERPVSIERDLSPRLDWWPAPLVQIAPNTLFRWSANVPLWIPFVLLAAPTLFLWRLDRRRPQPGHCRKCDYDLTGNTSGRCPECGTASGATDEQNDSAVRPSARNMNGPS